jgi:hypothetical protein
MARRAIRPSSKSRQACAEPSPTPLCRGKACRNSRGSSRCCHSWSCGPLERTPAWAKKGSAMGASVCSFHGLQASATIVRLVSNSFLTAACCVRRIVISSDGAPCTENTRETRRADHGASVVPSQKTGSSSQGAVADSNRPDLDGHWRCECETQSSSSTACNFAWRSTAPKSDHLTLMAGRLYSENCRR